MSKVRLGLYLVLGTAVISGFSVFLNSLAVKVIANSDVHTTAKNMVATLLLSLLIVTPLAIKKLMNLKLADWLKLIIIGLIGGSIPFLLFFKAVSLTTAVNAGFIHKTLFIWVSLLAIYFLKEKIGKWQYLALFLLFIGNFVLAGCKFISLDYGALLALSATLFWAVEFVLVKKWLSNIDSLVIGWGRMFFGSVFLAVYLLFIGQFNLLVSLNSFQWRWELLLGILLAGYVITWYRALSYLPAITAASVLVLASPLTTLLNTIFITKQINSVQALGVLLILMAIGLISYPVLKTKYADCKSEQFI